MFAVNRCNLIIPFKVILALLQTSSIFTFIISKLHYYLNLEKSIDQLVKLPHFIVAETETQ